MNNQYDSRRLGSNTQNIVNASQRSHVSSQRVEQQQQPQPRVMYRHFPDGLGVPPPPVTTNSTQQLVTEQNQNNNMLTTTMQNNNNENNNRVETQHPNIVEQNTEFIRQLRQSQGQLSQNQREQQEKYMQNYLNQSLRGCQLGGANDKIQQSNPVSRVVQQQHSSLDQHKQVQNRLSNNPPVVNHGSSINPYQSQMRSNSVINNRNLHNQSALSIPNNNNINNNPTDPRKNHPQYACLLIKRAEFFCTKENLVKHSNYLMRVFERQDFSTDLKDRSAQVKIRLPESTKGDVLIMFLDYIDKGKELPNKIDLYIAQNIILIAEALKMRQIEKKFLLEILMPMLNRENIIFFTKMAYNKLTAQKNEDQKQIQDELESQTSHQEEEGFWLEFFSYALDFAALHILYLLKKKENELLTVLETQIIEEIIERGIKFYRTDLSYDNTLLFDTLMKLKKCDSIFQLLETERLKITELEQKQIDEQNDCGHVSPTLTWNIQNLSGNFYKESDPFMVENAQWKLSVSYFRMDEEALSVQIKMLNNPFEVKKSRDYFKKKDFFLPSNVAGGNQHQPNFMELDDDNLTQEEIQKKRKQMEQASQDYPSHSFVTIVSSVRIDKNDHLSDPLVNTLICSAKTPALLRKFNDFRIEDQKTNGLHVEIYLKIKYLYSSILLYISKNFSYLITDPLISLLPKEQFKLLLKHKLLNVTQEDEVVKGVCMWAEGQELRLGLDSDLSELLENVNWNFVTLSCLLDLIRNFPYVRRNMTFHKILNKEFHLRNKFNPESTNLDAPRFSYKFNKTQNIPLAAKDGKNAKALLYINHDNFFQVLIDQLLEPVDIIKAHLVNEGINESSHRKHLELQLLQKKREIGQIEEQIANMRLMDDLNNQSRSRPNSQLTKVNAGGNRANSQLSQGQQHNNSLIRYQQQLQQQRGHNVSQEGDEIETVKNSMINLLNVVIEGEGENNKRSTQQGVVTRGQHLVELSQEAIQKMQQQINSDNQELNEEEELQQPAAFENMYQELESMAQNRKIQIMFKTQDFDEESKNYQVSQISSEQEMVEGATPLQEQLESEHENQQEEEDKSFNLHDLDPHSKITQNKKPNVKTQPVHQGTSSQSSYIIFGGGSIVSPTQQAQMFSLNYPTPPPAVAAQKQDHDLVQITHQACESKSIQTSLQNFQRLSRIQQQVVDQSIQMTFEEPPVDQSEQSMLKQQHQDEQSDDIMEDNSNNEIGHQHFISHSSVHHEQQIDLQQQEQDDGQLSSVQSLHTALMEGQNLQQQQLQQIEQQSPRVQDSKNNNKNKMLEQLKIKYQKQLMQEYTSLVQQMSQDVFDQNFLKNFNLFSPGCISQVPTADVTNSYVVPSPFSPTQQPNNQVGQQHLPQGNQISVRNPKVHNLNISIHNNANYASPYNPGLIDSLPTNPNLYTPLQRFTPTVQSPLNSKQITTNHQKSLHLKKGKTPTNQLNPNFVLPLHERSLLPTTQLTQNSTPKTAQQLKPQQTSNNNVSAYQQKPQQQLNKPKSAQQQYTTGVKKPMIINIPTNSGGEEQSLMKSQGMHHSSQTAQNFNTIQVDSGMSSMKNVVKNKQNQNNQVIIQKGQVHQNNNVLNSVKNANNLNQQQLFMQQNKSSQGVQNQQSKAVKNSSKNQQNKFILQSLLNETQKLGYHGESLLDHNASHAQQLMTLDHHSTQPARGGGGPHMITPSSQNQYLQHKIPPHHHQKSHSVGNSAFIMQQQQQQWGMVQGGNGPQSTQNKIREGKSNEMLQNEIIRMIVEDIPVPQMQHEPKLQNWIQPQGNIAGYNGFSNMMSHSFSHKRSSVQSQIPLHSGGGFAPNFNILDDLKHQAQTPQYQTLQRSSNPPQIFAQTPQNQQQQKPTSAGVSGFGSLASHQRQNSTGNGGNVVLDLAQLKMAATTKNAFQHTHLGTIEESKKSGALIIDSESNGGTHEIQNRASSHHGSASHSSLMHNGQRKNSYQSNQQSHLNRVGTSSQHSIKSQHQGYQGQNRCQPHDLQE